jgi:hypothetical protein
VDRYSTLYTPDVRERLQKKLGPRVEIERSGAIVIATVFKTAATAKAKQLDAGSRMSSASTFHLKL